MNNLHRRKTLVLHYFFALLRHKNGFIVILVNCGFEAKIRFYTRIENGTVPNLAKPKPAFGSSPGIISIDNLSCAIGIFKLYFCY